MKNDLIIVLVVTCLCILTPTYGQWQKNIVDDNLSGPIDVHVNDIDGDNRLDLIVTDVNKNELIWYKNNYPKWSKNIIDNVHLYFAYGADINSNDTLDVVACLYNDRQIVWYENKHPTWTKHIIDENTDNAEFMLVADFNNDGKNDVVTAGNYVDGGDVVWYENNHPEWIEHIIESGSGGYPSLNINDFDGDGLFDVAATMKAADSVVWFRNENNGQTWTKYSIDNSLDGAFGINSNDINGDNKVDIVATSRDLNDVIWYENNHPSWTKHIIDENFTGANWPYITDVDGDDTMDVIVGSITSDGVVWFENNHPVWTKHLIEASVSDTRILTAADIDGDSINDAIVASNGIITWNKNPNTDAAYATSLEVLPYYIDDMSDTLKFNVDISNPMKHEVNIKAIIDGFQTEYKDSLQLFDDGLHSDSISSDDIWGNIKLATEFPEDAFSVSLVTSDLTKGIQHYFPLPSRIINYGPIVLESYSFTGTDMIPNPGDIIKLELTIKNNSVAATASNIKAKIVSLDTLITVTSHTKSFEDIPAGESSTSIGSYTVSISGECPPEEDVVFDVRISSFGAICWSNTLSFEILTVVAPFKEDDVIKFYPNPTNNILNIVGKNTGIKEFGIEIVTLTGRVIYKTKHNECAPYFETQIDISGYSQGIYIVKVKLNNAVFTKRLVIQ